MRVPEKMSFFDVVAAMRMRTKVNAAGNIGNIKMNDVDVSHVIQRATGWISSIEAEDGSGLSWNIGMDLDGGGRVSVYWNEYRAPCPFTPA